MSEPSGTRTHFRVCSTCRAPIPFGGLYYRCSVSTCNRPRTAFYFCSVACWDAHVPGMRHRDAWAEEAHAPSRAEWEAAERAAAMEEETRTTRRIERPNLASLKSAVVTISPESPGAPIGEARGGARSMLNTDGLPEDVLVVVSKLKAYVRARGDLKTSDGIMPILSDILRQVCDEGILRAKEAGRQTLLDRDLPRRWRPEE